MISKREEIINSLPVNSFKQNWKKFGLVVPLLIINDSKVNIAITCASPVIDENGIANDE